MSCIIICISNARTHTTCVCDDRSTFACNRVRTGKITKWVVKDSDNVIVPEQDHGIFYDSEAYVIRWGFLITVSYQPIELPNMHMRLIHCQLIVHVFGYLVHYELLYSFPYIGNIGYNSCNQLLPSV